MSAPSTRTFTTTALGGNAQTAYLPRPLPPPSSSASSPVTFEDVARFPKGRLGRTGAPTKIRFDDVENRLLWLGVEKGSATTQRLWGLDLDDDDDASLSPVEIARPPSGAGEENVLSADEKLRRERSRQLETGITDFDLLPRSSSSSSSDANANALLYRAGDDAFVLRRDGSTVALGPSSDPRATKDGRSIVFLRNREVHVRAVGDDDDDGKRLTFGARGTDTITNGAADFLAAEEMERPRGFWISPSDDLVAFQRTDDARVPAYRIVNPGSETDPYAEETHRYPFAGKDNPEVTLGVVDVETTNTRWLDLSSVCGEDFYLARVEWGVVVSDESSRQPLYVQVMNRAQTELVLLRFDVERERDVVGSDDSSALLVGTELLRETREESWINLHDCFVPLKKSGGFLWASERTDFQHLYRYNDDGDLLNVVTAGDDWMVEKTSSSMVDEDKGVVYFTGTKDGPKECHLYKASLDGTGEVERVTPAGGTHTVLDLSCARGAFVDLWSDAAVPYRAAVRSLEDGSIVRELYDGARNDPRALELDLVPPEFFDVIADDGATTLHCALYRPDGDGPHPAVVSVYGGPHAQMVRDDWSFTSDLRAQRLRAAGFAVVKCDNRGSARRGLAFETALHRDAGNVEVRDQSTVVEHLTRTGVVDPERVGIYGWSYGGYMSAMSLCRRPDLFRAAVAGAPVTHWDGYDTCYTERYMGTPENNPDGYERSSVSAHVDSMSGSLLLVHGCLDENVHVRHTTRLVNALIRARKHHELLLFPNERHVPRGFADKVFMEERVASFLERCL